MNKYKLLIDNTTQDVLLRGLLKDFIRRGWKEINKNDTMPRAKKKVKAKVHVVFQAEILLGRLPKIDA